MAVLADLVRSPRRTALAIIAVSLVFHLIVMATLGLGVDECYTISVAHDLKLSYFDHPPLHYWIAHGFMPVLGDGRLARLPFVAMFTATSWMMFLLTRQLYSETAGAWAVLALNLSAFFTLAGGWILPDGPLMLCLVAAAWTLARAFFPQGEAPSPWLTWIVAGAWIGLACLSKYHAALFVAGLFVFMVTSRRRAVMLLHPAPWVGAVVAAVIVSPVVIWNAQHDWASFAFQAGRAGGAHSFPNVGRMLTNIGGQLLWILPWIFVPLVVATWQAVRAGRRSEASWFGLCLGLPAIVVFTLNPLWGSVGLPHWQMPGWLMLYPLFGAYLAAQATVGRRTRIWAATSAGLLIVLASIADIHAATGVGRLLFPSVFAKGDPTLEAYEWTPIRGQLAARGLLDPRRFIVAVNWIEAGKIDQALSDTMAVQVFGERKQYAYRADPASFVGRDALIIGTPDRIASAETGLSGYFEQLTELPPIVFGRSGMSEVTLRVIAAKRLTKPLIKPGT
ncbi:MAG: glycosyltransferase family 39 protein [Proteobacteria bacterium]|nr:glycosyltransferase family 39 protein [Pseudomonadota bacterium]